MVADYFIFGVMIQYMDMISLPMNDRMTSHVTFEIINDIDRDRLYATGSFTKMMTTFVCLSKLAEEYDLNVILDDEDFLDRLCSNPEAREFLNIFQRDIHSKFTIRDVCTYYNGLPYTFDLADEELERADRGEPFKHHHIMDEEVFLTRCRNLITQVDPNHGKFHYSELAIIFFGYFIEKVYGIQIESLYQQYVIDAFSLPNSLFSRTKPPHVYCQDLSDKYDYPAIAITDHGYFCYSNGFFTTLNDEKKLLEHLLKTPVFAHMCDISKARAASNTIMNGLTVELRVVGDDILYGYEGLSYSGCNIWAYSSKQQKGFVMTTNDEDKAYDIYQQFGYDHFDKAPDHTQIIYREFLASKHYEYENKSIPAEYIGDYQRVVINTFKLEKIFKAGDHFIVIRNPEEVKYDVLYDHGTYRITCKDHMHGTKVGFHQAKSGSRYMFFDGNLYKKI